MQKIRALTCALALFVTGASYSQQPAPKAASPAAQQAADPAELYGVREGVEHIDISPDGNRVVYLQPGPGRSTFVLVHDLTTHVSTRIIRSDGAPERLVWCNFVTNERLICRFVAMMSDGEALIPYARLMAVGADGQNPVLLGERESAYDSRLRQYDGNIIDWLGGGEGAVLMARDYVPEAGRMNTRLVRTTSGLGVDRVDVRTGRSTRVEPPNARAGRYLSDGRGNVRIMSTPTVRGATGQLGTRTDHFYRIQGESQWRSLGSYDSETHEGLWPTAIDPALNVAYVLRKLDGRMALYRVRLDASLASELVYANPQVDVDDVVRASRGTRVVGVTFAEETRRVVYFDPDYEALARSLGRAIPNLPLIDFGTDSADGQRILVHAGSDSDAGRFYVYDRTSRSLIEILMVRPQLETMPTANVRAVSYPATDGTMIPAYLTLPPGSNGRNLPVVVMPHGGPEARDEWGFDWLAQYLAHQGYAVLQPNFRGSGGYGDAWLQQNGFRGWRTSIGDITAGARWLIAQGIADPNRVAIMGWSYGGYAALQAAATEPPLFRAVVAIAPVTDLQQLKEDYRFYTSRRNIADYIGTGPHVAEGSPLRRAEAITAPVLLFHGDRDLNVNVNHSRRMDAALRSAGRRSELTIFPGLEHDLGDSTVRVQMLRRIGVFLAAELPAR
jgi:dipeptidyl aminopeptidase/acylaminoacyl peptidase